MTKYNSLLSILEVSVIKFLGTPEGYQFMTIEQEASDGRRYIINVAYKTSPKGLVLDNMNIKLLSEEAYLIFMDEMCEKNSIEKSRDFYLKEVEWDTPLPYPISSWDK